MPNRITDFFVVELPSPPHAEALAARISSEYRQAGIREDGLLRPVIWAGSPLASRGVLYLSVGAVRAAEGAGIQLEPLTPISHRELPMHRTLLLGTPRDRV